MAGDARAAEREPRRGRHRRGSGGPTWTPELPRAVHLRPGSGAPDFPAPRDALADLPATGLRKFNLGTIPASVTPPRTWRKAAAFAVGTAVLVVVGLGYAAITLVGNPRRGNAIDALPGQPSQHLVITGLPGESAEALTQPQPTSSAPAGRTTTSATPQPAIRDARAAARPDAVPPARPGAADPGRPASPDVAHPGAPARSTVGLAAAPPTDPDKMGDRTEEYYANVTRNPQAACQLTTGPMRAEGPEGIEARYADVQRVEVEDITIDPNWSYTRSTLVIVHKDGTRTTVHRELRFSPGPDPKITSDSAA